MNFLRLTMKLLSCIWLINSISALSPTGQPTTRPSILPSGQPTFMPSSQPTKQPSIQPSAQPSVQPSSQPSHIPSRQPSKQPINRPTTQPSRVPSRQPTHQPTEQPTHLPSAQPSRQPTRQPTEQPTRQPSGQPSFQPSSRPTQQPFGHPSSRPSKQPQSRPSSHPSSKPTSPSGQPTQQPSRQPSIQPTVQPSKPTYGPTPYPTINGFYLIIIELQFVGINASRALATGGFNTSLTSFLANVFDRSPSIFTVLSIYPAPPTATGAVTRHRYHYRYRSLRSLLTTITTAAATTSTSIINSASSILVQVSYHSQNPSTNEMIIALSAALQAWTAYRVSVVSVTTRSAAPTGSPSAAPTSYNTVYMAEGLVVGGVVLVVLMVCILQRAPYQQHAKDLYNHLSSSSWWHHKSWVSRWNQWKKSRKKKKGNGMEDDENDALSINPTLLKSLHVFALHDQDVDEQGRDNHLRVVKVVEFLASQGYLVKMTAASATASSSTAVTAASASIDKPMNTVEEGHASGGIASTSLNEVRTIEDTLASIDHTSVLIVFVTQSYMSRVAGLGGVGVGEKGKSKSKGSHYHDLCMQLFLYATSSQLHNHHQKAGAFLVVIQEESCRDVTKWEGPTSLLASSLTPPSDQSPPPLSTDTHKNEPSASGVAANDNVNPLTATGETGAAAGDLTSQKKEESTFTHYIDNVHDADFDRNMIQLLHSLDHLISAEEKKKIIRNAARLEEKLTADAFMGVSGGAANKCQGSLSNGSNNKDKSGNVPIKQFQGHNVALDASSLMWSGDQALNHLLALPHAVDCDLIDLSVLPGTTATTSKAAAMAAAAVVSTHTSSPPPPLPPLDRIMQFLYPNNEQQQYREVADGNTYFDVYIACNLHTDVKVVAALQLSLARRGVHVLVSPTKPADRKHFSWKGALLKSRKCICVMTPAGFRRSDNVSANSPYQSMHDMLQEYENAWSIHAHCQQRRFQPTSYVLPLLVSEESVTAMSTTAAATALASVNDGDMTAGDTAGADIDASLVLPTTAGVEPLPTSGELTSDASTAKPSVTMLVPCRDLVTRPMGVSLSRSGKDKDHGEEGEEGRRVPFRARKKPIRGANPARLLPPIGANAGAVVAVVNDEGVLLESNGEIANGEGTNAGAGNDTTDAVDKKPSAVTLNEENNQMATLPLRQKAVPSFTHSAVQPTSSTVLSMDG